MNRARINHNGSRYTNEDLHRIGNNVAMLWGAYCYDFRVSHKKRSVCFYCIEHGERFVCYIDFDELAIY